MADQRLAVVRRAAVAEPVPSPTRRVLLGLALFVVAAFLPLLRQRGVPSWETIWAEDGAVFFAEAHRDGPLAPLFRPYVGYLLVVPRLAGAAGSMLRSTGSPHSMRSRQLS